MSCRRCGLSKEDAREAITCVFEHSEGKLAKRAEYEDWDLPPQTGTLFQLSADVLRKAEVVYRYTRLRPKVQNEDKLGKLLLKMYKIIHESEEEFRIRIFYQLGERPLSKVLL